MVYGWPASSSRLGEDDARANRPPAKGVRNSRLLAGARLAPREALALGLVQRALPPQDKLLPHAMERAAALASEAARGASLVPRRPPARLITRRRRRGWPRKCTPSPPPSKPPAAHAAFQAFFGGAGRKQGRPSRRRVGIRILGNRTYPGKERADGQTFRAFETSVSNPIQDVIEELCQRDGEAKHDARS